MFLLAWISLGMQVDVLIGSRGLLPIAEHLADARRQGTSFFEFPTPFWIVAGDRAVTWGIAGGGLLALAAMLGKRPRLCLFLSSALYLGYATACRNFLGFQWDNLLIECGVLATLLPEDRPARWAHVLLRLLLFKVYFESGVSKWLSHLGDWRDGSAMALYYETAPLPTPLAHLAHALPAGWHRVESWATLVFELAVPWCVFGTRRMRLFALAAMTAFQAAIFLSANYGFFCPLMIILGALLLDEGDAVRWMARIRRRQRPAEDRAARRPGRLEEMARRMLTTMFVTLWVWISFTEGMAYFDRAPEKNWDAAARGLRPFYEPWRVANTYHLFGHVTRERVEPEFQTTLDGKTWTAQALRFKPGEPKRSPPWVAPHQPRVDFQLWFHGLAFRRGMPVYAAALLDRLCVAPDAIASLFAEPPPKAPQAVRIAYWRYRFTTPPERRKSGAWWSREWVRATPQVACSDRAVLRQRAR